MKILAIETSDKACSIALINENEITSSHVMAPMQQSKIILSLINDLLYESHIKLQQLTAIAFGCGPGSFTGIRIATSVAQGLGYALDLPLIPISSLAALAQSVTDSFRWKELLVAVDARMNEIFWGVYTTDEHGLVRLVNTEKLCLPEQIDLPSMVTDGYGVGSGWEVYQNALIKKSGIHPSKINPACLPSAHGVARLALEKYHKGLWINPADAQPVYLRDKVVG